MLSEENLTISEPEIESILGALFAIYQKRNLISNINMPKNHAVLHNENNIDKSKENLNGERQK